MNKTKNRRLLPLIFGFSLPLLLAGCPSAFNTSPKSAQSYTVRYFDTDGRWLKGRNNLELSHRVSAGAAVPGLPKGTDIHSDDTPDGYELAGWSVMIGGLGEVYTTGETPTITRKTDFYAVWVETRTKRKFTYVLGEGQGNPPVDNRGYSDETVLTVRDPGSLTPPAGKVFVGWQNGTTFYPAGSAWLLLSNSPFPYNTTTTFTAVWADKEQPTTDGFEYAVLPSGFSSSSSPYNGGVIITGYTGAGGTVTIPSDIGGKPVVSIGYDAFQGKGLTSVSFSENLLSIGANAFRDNALVEITLPASLTHLGKYAFARNKLRGVIVSGTEAGTANLGSIGEYAFFDNALSHADIPQQVALIGDYAFYRNKLPAAGLRSRGALTHIGHYAFYDNHLRGQLIIPYTVTAIGIYAFAGNQPLVEGAASTGNQIPALRFEDGSLLETIGIGAFADNNLGSDGGGTLTIPASVQTIEREAFTGNVLWKVIFISPPPRPTDKLTIGIEAFSYNELRELELPGHLASLGSSAFAHNKISGNRHGSTVLSFPPAFTDIGDSAFLDNKLTEIVLHSGIRLIKAGTFHLNDIQTITLGAGVDLKEKAMGNYDDGRRITIFQDYYRSVGSAAGTYTYYRPDDPDLGWK